MPNIAVSAHGGRWSSQQPDLTVQGGGQVVFYENDGEILSNTDGYAILGELNAGNEPGGTVVQQVASGSDTFDYSCWFAPEFGADCGIFEVGTGQLLKDLSGYTEDQPLPLSEILSEYPGVTVYWVACREVSVDGESTFPVQQAEDVFPGPRPA